MEEMLKQILGELQGINSRLDSMDARMNKLETGQEEIKSDIQDLKKGQEEIKDMIRDNEGKQGKNHLEVIEEIQDIKRDLDVVESMSIKNLYDIKKLRVIK